MVWCRSKAHHSFVSYWGIVAHAQKTHIHMHKPSKYSSDVTQSGVDGGTVAKNVRESESVALDDAVNARLKMST